ncbi:CopG family antitoxin [Polynucleobacter sp. AP-Nino-20-G2]|uniref:CopG family antitoxin n=1 Tax=Polynucleobacter sp. AP-Nino-20-G2 TaxID=2576917 RepID=UPI001BFD8F85|nr:CopG family antitoxin [Polynucleobacter sp. AP-Nino-20-G2]QWE16931.1 hypothetical protein FD960_01515 [Polynucleobacter sp. AP-Nino-20-G2]
MTKSKANSCKPIPQFASEQEECAFWKQYDTSSCFDLSKLLRVEKAQLSHLVANLAD